VSPGIKSWTFPNSKSPTVGVGVGVAVGGMGVGVGVLVGVGVGVLVGVGVGVGVLVNVTVGVGVALAVPPLTLGGLIFPTPPITLILSPLIILVSFCAMFGYSLKINQGIIVEPSFDTI